MCRSYTEQRANLFPFLGCVVFQLGYQPNATYCLSVGTTRIGGQVHHCFGSNPLLFRPQDATVVPKE